MQVRGNQVSVLGLVNKPGRYPLEQAKMKLTDALALAGVSCRALRAASCRAPRTTSSWSACATAS